MVNTTDDDLKAEWFRLGWLAAIREAAANVRAGRDEFWEEQARDAGDEVRVTDPRIEQFEALKIDLDWAQDLIARLTAAGVSVKLETVQ